MQVVVKLKTLENDFSPCPPPAKYLDMCLTTHIHMWIISLTPTNGVGQWGWRTLWMHSAACDRCNIAMYPILSDSISQVRNEGSVCQRKRVPSLSGRHRSCYMISGILLHTGYGLQMHIHIYLYIQLVAQELHLLSSKQPDPEGNTRTDWGWLCPSSLPCRLTWGRITLPRNKWCNTCSILQKWLKRAHWHYKRVLVFKRCLPERNYHYCNKVQRSHSA